MKKILSIIIPVYNEEKNISLIYRELIKIFEKINKDYLYEIVFIDDWSNDKSWFKILELSHINKQIKAIRFSKNFWHQSALIAWYNKVKWDIIITMDCDLQDPPKLILKMLKKYEKWNYIVYARREIRHENIFKKYTAICYYKFHSKISDTKIPSNVWDFRLIDKIVLKSFLKLKEKDKYIRWIFPRLWYKSSFVDFERVNRKNWKTGYTFIKMLRLAMDGILSFSMFPLRIWMIIGFFMIIVSFLFLSYIIYDSFINNVFYPLFKWISVIWFGFMWLQFIFIWIIWEYVWRVYSQVRWRPNYIIEEKINFK